jgi:uncharacterized membrane protein YfcA
MISIEEAQRIILRDIALLPTKELPLLQGLVNSIAGLLGHIGSLQAIPRYVPILAVAALAGGVTGSFFGSRRLPASGIVRALSVVLIIAGFKLLFA